MNAYNVERQSTVMALFENSITQSGDNSSLICSGTLNEKKTLTVTTVWNGCYLLSE